jgi:hypothetical protein
MTDRFKLGIEAAAKVELIHAGLCQLFDALQADDPKKELAIRITDLMDEAKILARSMKHSPDDTPAGEVVGQRFMLRVNDGPEQTIEVATGIYMHAAAAAVAILDLKLPANIRIWSPELVPEYGPYFYIVDYDEYQNLRVRHAVLAASPAPVAGDWNEDAKTELAGAINDVLNDMVDRGVKTTTEIAANVATSPAVHAIIARHAPPASDALVEALEEAQKAGLRFSSLFSAETEPPSLIVPEQFQPDGIEDFNDAYAQFTDALARIDTALALKAGVEGK